jgi:capsular exopolysaccharide synthesis family protein
MSQIFDALQRSEAERSGIDLSGLREATEVLRRAERQATAQWQAETLPVQPEDTGSSQSQETTSFGLHTPLPVGKPVKAPETSDLSLADECLDVFGLFQSLRISPTPQSRLICLTDSQSPAAEAFRLLGVRLRHLRRDRLLKRLLITSTSPQEGKSTVAANLAYTLATKTQQRILLLEGDVRRPALTKLFGVGTNDAGICECLQGHRSLVTSICHLEGAGFWILPAGNTQNNPLELLQSGKLSALMDQLNSWFDWIIIDSPPVLPLADTSVWMRLSDGILLVSRQGTTVKRQLQRGLEALEQRKVIGALLNASKHPDHDDYYYGPANTSRSDDATS